MLVGGGNRGLLFRLGRGGYCIREGDQVLSLLTIIQTCSLIVVNGRTRLKLKVQRCFINEAVVIDSNIVCIFD